MKSFRARARTQLHMGLTTELADKNGEGAGGEEAQTRTLLFPHVPIPVSNMEVKIELSFGGREI